MRIFKNSENNKTSDAHRLRLYLTDKMDDEVMLLHCQILVSNTHGRIQKSHTKTINVKYQKQYGMKSLNLLVNLISYRTLKTILKAS